MFRAWSISILKVFYLTDSHRGDKWMGVKVVKVLAGFFALVLTVVATSLLFGHFFPAFTGRELTALQHLAYFASGLVVLGLAIKLWVWSTKTPSP